jgi:hypothetical protein
VLTAWVTLYAHRIGNTSGAICLGKIMVIKNNGGDSFRNFYETKMDWQSCAGVGGSAEKQLTNGSGGFTNGDVGDWGIGHGWRAGFTTGPARLG